MEKSAPAGLPSDAMRRIAIGLLLSEPGVRGRTPETCAPAPPRLRGIVERAVRAEQLGFDSIWLDGETPSADALRATPVLLAAIAARTTRLRLGGGVPLCAGLDPLRVAEDFATLDGLSSGRVEVVVSAGGFAAPSGGDPGSADACRDRLRETIELLRRLWTETDVDWSGEIRGPLERVTVQPRPVQRPHPPLWIGGDAAPQWDALAAELDVPRMLACGSGPSVPAQKIGACRFVGFGDRTPPQPPGTICGSAAQVLERLLAERETLGWDVLLVGFERTGHPDAAAAEDLERFGRDVLPVLQKT
jgi:hypothetical protein